MNRIAVLVVTLAVVAGSVPAAAAFADGTSSQLGGEEPGAAFAGVVGVQQAEVDNEVAQRSLAQQFAAAESNDSKAGVVADQSQQLSARLDELEAEKQRLKQARENGSISQGEYKARLAALGAEIRAVEKRATQTADVAESLPEEALRAKGANVSEVRRVAQQANRTGGGEVAEAARSIAGENVGNGLGPPNGSERGPPDGAGPDGNGNDPDGNESGPPEGADPVNGSTAGNASENGASNTPENGSGSGNATTNGSDRGQNTTGNTAGDSPGTNTSGGNATVPGGNGTAGANDTAGNGMNETGNDTGTDSSAPNGTNATGQNESGTGQNATDSGTGSPEAGDDDGATGDAATESTATATPTA